MTIGLSESGYASARNRIRSRAPSTILVCAAMLLAPFFALVPIVASDPIDIDNPDYTGTVTWDFSSPEDYETTGITIDDGVAGLSLLNESVTEESKDDYANGTMVNLDDLTAPGSLVLDETTTSSTVLELQPDAATGQDSFIYEDRENDNYGTERELRIDSEVSRVYRTLLKFDFPTIPASAYVNEATLWLYQNPGGKGDDISFTIHALNRSFVEDEVSWRMCSTSAFWTTPGGDFSTQAYAAGVLNNSDDWKSFDLSNLVECWIRGTVANNGLIIVPSEASSDSVKEFISSDEESWPELRPRLSIDYTVQGNEGAYESGALGPGTNCTFTTAGWTNSSLSLLNDEFAQAPLSAKWTWWNDPVAGGGSYNVGLTTPGWLHVLGSPNSLNRDTTINSNYLYQEITGNFDATSSIRELFTVDYMHAGILIVDNNADWVSISKTGIDSDGEIVVVLCENGASSTVASVAWEDQTTARLRVVRDDTGIRLYASAVGSPWTEVHELSGISTLKQKLKIGLFVSSESSAQPQAEFSYFRVEPLEAPTLQIMLRTGNSSSLSDPSWSDWTSPFLESSTVLGTTAKYIRYRIYMATDYEWLTPAFSGFTAHWERHAPYGLVETADYTPTDFSSWLSFNAIHNSSGGSVEYYFSTDGGDSWDFLTSDASTTLYSLEQTLRIRAALSTYDTLTATSVDEFSATYGTALSTFYVVAPSTVVAGDPFTLDIWTKNGENQTLINWIGTVDLTAMDATGTVEASSDLEIASGDIVSAGHATIDNQRYYSAETICILVDSGGITGLSAPVEVRTRPIASLKMLPE
ncbi:MAG: DNRLRE domain-containing protein, partial [Methanobacteriota archaeon]